MVEGGGFEPPKLTRQIYNLIPLAAREPLQNQAGNSEAKPRQCQPSKSIFFMFLMIS